MFSQFNEILKRFCSTSGGFLTRMNSEKMSPFKVQMNLDIPNLEGNIDAESVDNWVQQLESYYSMNQLSKAKNITIVSLNMSTYVHCWWEKLSTKMEKDGDPIKKLDKFFEYIQKDFYPPE